MENPIRALCIDLDDTLWPVAEAIDAAERALMDWLARRYPRVSERHDETSIRARRQEIAGAYPAMRHDLTFLRKQVLASLAADCGYPQRMADEAFEVFFEARCRVSLYADVLPALRQLSAALPLIAVTNGNACLRRVRLEEYFVDCIYARDVGAAKPDPRVFAAAATRLALAPREVLHVGDDPVADVAGARSAGMQCAWLNRGARAWPEELTRPDHELAHLGELAEHLAPAVGTRGRTPAGA